MAGISPYGRGCFSTSLRSYGKAFRFSSSLSSQSRRPAREQSPSERVHPGGQFARSSPHKKKGRLTTDSFFNVWRWRDREYAYRPRLKIFSSKNFGLATDSLILFANKMMLRRSIPARRVCRHSAHLHTKKQKAPNGANVFTCGDGGNRTRVRRELLYKSTCLIYSMV